MAIAQLHRAGQAQGFGIVGATIAFPRLGAWVADLRVDAQEALTGAVDLVVAGGARTLKGTVLQGAVVEGILVTRVAAGAGGMQKLVTPRHYTTPAIRTVLGDILRNVGETLSATASSAILGQVLEHWTTRRQSAGKALRALFERAPAASTWRLLDDGGFWVGEDTWAEADIAGVRELGSNPADGSVEVGLDEPYLRPGITLSGRRVDSAELRLTGGAITATIWTPA